MSFEPGFLSYKLKPLDCELSVLRLKLQALKKLISKNVIINGNKLIEKVHDFTKCFLTPRFVKSVRRWQTSSPVRFHPQTWRNWSTSSFPIPCLLISPRHAKEFTLFTMSTSERYRPISNIILYFVLKKF